VSALLTVALVASLSVAAVWQQWRSIEVEGSERQRLQARWLVAGALDWARAILGEDGLRQAAIDHNGEAWAQPLGPVSLQAFLAGLTPAVSPGPPPTGDEPLLSLQLQDAQARLNVLNLLEGPGISRPWLQVFGRLFQRLGLPASELNRLAEQLRRASQGTVSASAAAARADAPLMPTRQADLIWLGLAPATVEALQPHVSLLPGRLPVNLNTAGGPVLEAVLGLEPAQAQRLIARRQARPLSSLSDTGIPTANEQMHAVNSHFFEVQVQLKLSGGAPTTLLEHALLQRDGQEVRTLWQRRLPPLPGGPFPSGTVVTP
jgi:general secretion pathway protein K